MRVKVKVRSNVERVKTTARTGGIGTKDYEKLTNLPWINDVELKGKHNGEYYGLIDLTKYNLDLEKQNQKDLNQDEDIKLVTNDLKEFKQAIAKEQQVQDQNIQNNAKELTKLDTDLTNYKTSNDAKQLEQDSKIQANTTKFNEYDTTIVIDKKLAKKVDLKTYEAEQKVQDENIQTNALGLLEKVDKKDYEAAETAQNALIEANKQSIETTNQTLETYKQETTQGFHDERDLSLKEFKEAKDLANSKAVINDEEISPDFTMSSYEMATRVTCERTYKAKSIEINPVEGYPLLVTAFIEPQRQPNQDYVGWQNVDVTQDNSGTHKVFNQQLNSACFGGYYEFFKGKLTRTAVAEQFFGTEDTWKEVKLTNGRKHQFVLEGYLTNASNDLSKQLCNKYNVPKEVPAPDFNGVWIQDNKLFIGGAIADIYETLQEWRDYLILNPLQMVYGLQTPLTEVYEPQNIVGEVGLNKLYANSGDVEVKAHLLPICDGEGGKVDGIKLNGVLQIPDSDKIVNLEVITEGKVDAKIVEALAKIKTLQFKVVDQLPVTGETNIIYLVPIGAKKANNGYTEWAWIENQWELLGSTEIDLSGYLQKTDILEAEGTASDKVLSQKYVTEQLKLRITNEALTKLLASYATLGDIENFVTRNDVINDNVVQDSSAYSSKKMEEILKNAKYSPLIVNVQKRGESQYTADYNDNDIRNYVNADGIVKLRYENQEFAFDKYLAGVGAIFNYNEINKDLAQRIKIVVKFDKSVVVTTEKLLKVAEAENALKLNNIPANDFAMLVDIANMVEEPTEVALNANTILIKGWYKTNGDTANLPTELVDKTGFLRMLEYNHDTRSGIQVLYNVSGTIYLREIKSAQPQAWKQIPNIDSVNTIINEKGFTTQSYVDTSIQQAILDSWKGAY